MACLAGSRQEGDILIVPLLWTGALFCALVAWAISPTKERRSRRRMTPRGVVIHQRICIGLSCLAGVLYAIDLCLYHPPFFIRATFVLGCLGMARVMYLWGQHSPRRNEHHRYCPCLQGMRRRSAIATDTHADVRDRQRVERRGHFCPRRKQSFITNLTTLETSISY
jgi:hypothetical protein